MPAAKPLRHGTRTAYNGHECRCALCCAVQARYNRKYYRKRQTQEKNFRKWVAKGVILEPAPV